MQTQELPTYGGKLGPGGYPAQTLVGGTLPKDYVRSGQVAYGERKVKTLNTVDRNIDCVLVFDIHERDDVGQDSGPRIKESTTSYEDRLKVLKCMHAAGLNLTQSLSRDKSQWIIRISAPSALLEETAEKMGKTFKTKIKNTQDETNANLMKGFAEFKVEKKEKYEMQTANQFPSVERQRIILYIIERALGGNGHDFEKVKTAEVNKVFHLFPTHDPNDQVNLNDMWVWNFWDYQPLHKVRDYFGEEIAMYFAFLGNYTYRLAFLAVLGVVTFYTQLLYGTDSAMVPVYVMATAVWSIYFMEFWKQACHSYQVQWDVKNFEETQTDRIGYEGTARISPITGEDEMYFSDAERRMRYARTIPIICFSLLVVICAAIAVVLFQFFAIHSSTFPPGSGAAIAGCANAVVISVLNKIYEGIAEQMNEYENHQTRTAYEDAMILKVFLFQFVNSYAAMFYTAFLAGRAKIFGIEVVCSKHGCLHDVHGLILSTLALQIATGNIIEVFVPWVSFKVAEQQRAAEDEARRRAAAGEGANAPEGFFASIINSINPWHEPDDHTVQHFESGYELPGFVSKHEVEAHKPVYESTFGDYNELVIQYGYVTMFAAALPLGSFLCLINNIVEIHSDAFKLMNVYQRPFYKGTQDIGTWADILRVITVISVLTNCSMLAFTSNIFLRDGWVKMGKVGVVEMLVAVFIAEHIALFCQFVLADFIPDVPSGLDEQEERLKHKVASVLETQSDINKSNEVERKYELMLELIDEHDIAKLEDIHVKQWRNQPQYGSGYLVGVEPPKFEDGCEGKTGNRAHHEWVKDRQLQEDRKRSIKQEKFKQALYVNAGAF